MGAIQDEKCTGIYGVPSTYISILGHRRFSQYDFSSLRFGLMSGSVCPEPLVREVMERMGMKAIVIPYGQTETSPAITMTGMVMIRKHTDIVLRALAFAGLLPWHCAICVTVAAGLEAAARNGISRTLFASGKIAQRFVILIIRRIIMGYTINRRKQTK